MEKGNLYVVDVPVADLRREPKPHGLSYKKDPIQESQLLLGEKLIGKNEKDGWLYIEAIEQPKLYFSEWLGYTGWVPLKQLLRVESFYNENLVVCEPWAELLIEECDLGKSTKNISFGTRLMGKKKDAQFWEVLLYNGRKGKILSTSVRLLPLSASLNSVRQSMVDEGVKFLDTPYLWGGRSFYDSSYPCITSVDCSGLIHLLYRSHGFDIPRDAHDQFVRSKKCEYSELKPADLVFLADAGSERIGHVMLFTGEDGLLEATMQKACVMTNTGENKLTRSLNSIQNGEIVDQYRVFFGTLLEQ